MLRYTLAVYLFFQNIIRNQQEENMRKNDGKIHKGQFVSGPVKNNNVYGNENGKNVVTNHSQPRQ